MRRERLRSWALGILLAVPLVAGPGGDDPLRRKAFLGAALGPGEDGVAVVRVLPDTPAAKAGLEEGDSIVAFGGTPVRSPAELVEAVAKAEIGEPVELAVVRDEDRQTRSLTLIERPREQSDDFRVIYGSVPSGDVRLRTITTAPAGDGEERPALLIIQGLSCGSLDNPPGGYAVYRTIAEAFTKAGYVAMRVDKPGCGDSGGGPCADVDFETELDGYRQALKALKGMDGVDPERVFIFGHSMGGIMAPILAGEEPVRGVAVYGTVFKTWAEYEAENHRRQLAIAGLPYPEIDERVRNLLSLGHELYVAEKSPREVVEARPELADLVGEMIPDGEHLHGRSLPFFRQLAALNMPETWSRVDAHVLALWGKAEFVSTEADHALIAEQVNARFPGRGTFRALDGIDHGFDRAESAAEAFGRREPGEFNPAIIESLRGWADPLAGIDG